MRAKLRNNETTKEPREAHDRQVAAVCGDRVGVDIADRRRAGRARPAASLRRRGRSTRTAGACPPTPRGRRSARPRRTGCAAPAPPGPPPRARGPGEGQQLPVDELDADVVIEVLLGDGQRHLAGHGVGLFAKAAILVLVRRDAVSPRDRTMSLNEWMLDARAAGRSRAACGIRRNVFVTACDSGRYRHGRSAERPGAGRIAA